MAQKHLPEAWHLQGDDSLEVNGKQFTVKKIQFIESCHPEHCKDEKTFYLTDDYALEVNEDETTFYKIIRPNKNTENFEKVNLRSIKIFK